MASPLDRELTLGVLRRLLAGRNGHVELVAVGSDTVERTTLAGLAARAESLAAALAGLGVRPGDGVATLGWNSREHLECFWAVPCMGAVLHTLNPRLHAAQTAAAVAQAGDRVLLASADLLDLALECAERSGCVEHVVVWGAEEGAVGYEQLLADAPRGFDWPVLDERAGAGLCFTSGTSGAPKGVLYSHRALVLHALTMAAFDPHRTPEADRVLALVPFFHAMGWNLPYISALTGSTLVLPGRSLAAERIARLLRDEAVTISCGVPTVWHDVLQVVERDDVALPHLRAIACGGSRVPGELIRGWRARGVDVLQGWGMTETGPGASRVFEDPAATPEERERRRASGGRLRPLYDARIRADDGSLVPHDGTSVGEIELSGPLVITEYFGGPAAGEGRFSDGWLRTGDLGTIDAQGWVRIVDRAKDVIKSGGEWISSAALETALAEHPEVRDAAVIAMPDPRWMERPLACVVADAAIAPAALAAFLADRFPSWWVPRHYAPVEAIPRTATGKIDKRALRALLDAGALVPVAAGAAPRSP